MMTSSDRKTRLTDTLAILNHQNIDLKVTAEFIYDVYVLGMYADPKDYTRRARLHVKAIDAALVDLALQGAMGRMSRSHAAPLIFALAKVRQDLDGHLWRADRITEDMDRAA